MELSRAGGPGLKGQKYLLWQTCPGAMVPCPMKEGSTTEPLFCPHHSLAEGSWQVAFCFLTSQMGYNLPCPAFEGYWETLLREGRRKGREKWRPHLILLWLQFSLNRSRPRLGVALNSPHR